MTITLERPPSRQVPDGGVIEEARARQRRHRRMAGAATIAGLALLVGLFALTGSGVGSSHTARTTAPAPAGSEAVTHSARFDVRLSPALTGGEYGWCVGIKEGGPGIAGGGCAAWPSASRPLWFQLSGGGRESSHLVGCRVDNATGRGGARERSHPGADGTVAKPAVRTPRGPDCHGAPHDEIAIRKAPVRAPERTGARSAELRGSSVGELDSEARNHTRGRLHEVGRLRPACCRHPGPEGRVESRCALHQAAHRAARGPHVLLMHRHRVLHEWLACGCSCSC